jgi:hypothetical protein
MGDLEADGRKMRKKCLQETLVKKLIVMMLDSSIIQADVYLIHTTLLCWLLALSDIPVPFHQQFSS